MLLVALVLVLPVMAKKEAEEHSDFFKIENTIWNGKVDSLLSCSQMCAR